MNRLFVKGAREHNLKNIDVDLPRDAFVVISGMSGSGKSSLAFDTIFAEGQRRYVESLSAYARQFLGRMDKPDVDYIEGLSPAISIEQKTTNRNPRSTVGTVTEIWDYYRLLFARVGIPHDPTSGKRIEKQTVDEIIERILRIPEETRLMILAPVVRGRKGIHQRVLDDARRTGFARVRVNGEIISLDENIELDRNRKHSIEIVVDRVKVSPDRRKRIVESLETALETAGGTVVILVEEEEGRFSEQSFSQHYAYPDSNVTFPELEPRLFSFNSPFGACEACSGLGVTKEFDPDLIIPDRSLSFDQHGIRPYNPSARWYRTRFSALADVLGFHLNQPLESVPEEIMEQILYGSRERLRYTYEKPDDGGSVEYHRPFPGVIPDLERRYKETGSTQMREWFETFMTERICHECRGRRLRPESLAVLIHGHGIHEVAALSVTEALRFFGSLELTENERRISEEILKEIRSRLSFMQSVGLEYLTLDRNASTLSGGEAQRIRLATQIGSQLVGVLYVLDEPTIGLHQRDNERLLKTLLHLRDLGNTLLVVEHDEQTLRAADHIVDLGPGAGVHGGTIVAQGTPAEVIANPRSVTGPYLSGEKTIPVPESRRKGSGATIRVVRAREHNLKGIDVTFLLGAMNVITGVSGSGKSTLLSDILYPALANRINPRGIHHSEGAYDSLEGAEAIDKIINIDQSPIGRTPRSNPATYVGLFTPIRDLFAGLPESKARGYKPGRFSFNVKGGRCEHCQGAGTIKIEMHFLPDVYVTCDVCHGRRFTRETLDIRYKGRNIHDVLDMTIEEARDFFSPIPQIRRRLETLGAVGLDYVKLGQSALTLSGGEAQRVKLSLELSKRSTGKTLYILDEPTTGLHFADVEKLLEVLQLLVERGNSIILIEHNLDVILQADYVIDLGPEGGDRGGELIAQGTPEEVARVPSSHTGRFIAESLSRRPGRKSA
ncbi:MAG: excinuclease ABC subunit UvrA [Spirochaetaceae bacterium]|nr:MAG: excinuclease ABC subunit UvrA [Spirochaetaceae bacterium]